LRRTRIAAAEAPLFEIFFLEKIEEVHVQLFEYPAGHIEREKAFVLQDIVEVGLGDARQARQIPFGEFAGLDAGAKVFDQAGVKFAKVH
jgi:hypothetical protein